MLFLYKSFKETVHSEFCDKHIGYGIKLFEVAENTPHLLAAYNDIFLNEEEALDFAKRCTEEHLEPIHFKDAIDDTLLNI